MTEISPGHMLAIKALESVGKPWTHIITDNYPADQQAHMIAEITASFNAPPLPEVTPPKRMSTKRHRRSTLWCAGASLMQISRFDGPVAVSKQTIHQDIRMAVGDKARVHLASHRMVVSDEQVISLVAAYNHNQAELEELSPEDAATRLWSEFADAFID